MNDSPSRLDQASFHALVAAPARCELDPIRAALARADHDDAAVRALARLQLGHELPADVVAQILPGVSRSDVLLALVGHASGDVVEVLGALLTRRDFASDWTSADPKALTMFALWRRGPADRVRPIILPLLRRLSRKGLGPRAQGLLVWLGHQLADPHLLALLDAFHSSIDPDGGDGWAALADQSYTATVDEIVQALPARAVDALLPGTPARAAPRVGRNELCPCGSGKKFKRCCADNPDAVVTAGPSRAEQLAELAPRIQPDQVRRLARRDLATLDLDRLRDPALVTVLRQHGMQRDWARARAVMAAIRRRRAHDADEWLDELLHYALDARRFDVARELLPELVDPEQRALAEVAIALALDAPDALQLLRARARAALDDPSGVAAIDLAYTLLEAEPALGILVARGTLDAERMLDADTLLECIEEARDELLLPPWDPAGDRFAELLDEERAAATPDDDDDDDAATPAEQAALAEQAERLRAELDEASRRLATLQGESARHERDLRAAEAAATAAARRSSAESDPERRALRAKVDELKSLITEGNSERAELRRQLADAADTAIRTEPTAPDRRRLADDDTDLADVVAPPGGRRVALPRFTERARAALESVTHNVAAQALRHIGSLAAGDAAAWRGVKQAKDMPRQVLMTRIGIHHRLLFRSDDGALDILDLVTREALLTNLKHLRDA
jgi:hypothetical protein